MGTFSDIDPRDHPFIDRATGRTPEGFYHLRTDNRMQSCIERAKSYAPYCDLIWMETSHPKLSEAKEFSEGVRKVNPDLLKLFSRHHTSNFALGFPRKKLRVQLLSIFQLEKAFTCN